MKKLVRVSAVLSLMGMFVVFIYANNRTETALNIANDSQITFDNENLVAELTTDDKKLVKKTVSEKPTAATKSASAGSSKGSFVATAYCLRGRTAMGHGVRRGIIAADPRVLRLGSKINVGAGGYSGQYLVSDTGGKIKGKRLDIWMASCSEARRFGRRTVTVN